MAVHVPRMLSPSAIARRETNGSPEEEGRASQEATRGRAEAEREVSSRKSSQSRSRSCVPSLHRTRASQIRVSLLATSFLILFCGAVWHWIGRRRSSNAASSNAMRSCAPNSKLALTSKRNQARTRTTQTIAMIGRRRAKLASRKASKCRAKTKTMRAAAAVR